MRRKLFGQGAVPSLAMDRPPEGAGPRPPDADDPPERTSGLTLETCYRHPRVITGVHCTRCGRPICTDCMHPAAVGYQCPECVAEARRTAPKRRVPVRVLAGRSGALTKALLIVNVAMFLVEAVMGGSGSLFRGPDVRTLFDLGALYPPAIALNDQYWRLITPVFLHAGLIHLAFNSYALYLLGFLVEEGFGKIRFIAIYFLAGFLASVTSFVLGPVGQVGVGASGAIFGLLGAWVAFNYRRRTSPMASANLRWAFMLIGINVILGFSIPGIDWRAHFGGLVAGAMLGAVLEGLGPRTVRPLVQAGGLILLVALGLALTAWRVTTFPVAGLGG
jgi:membrane associated rhomboid family serine protease